MAHCLSCTSPLVEGRIIGYLPAVAVDIVAAAADAVAEGVWAF